MSPTLVSAAARAVSTPTFTDPAALVTWLIKSNNGRGFQFVDDAATPPVFSPGLRSALLASLTRSRQRNEPPWGADGDIILDTQEDGRHGTGCSPRSEPLRTVRRSRHRSTWTAPAGAGASWRSTWVGRGGSRTSSKPTACRCDARWSAGTDGQPSVGPG